MKEYTITNLKDHWNKYTKNYNKMVALKNKGKDWDHLLRIEEQLNLKGREIRKYLGIYATDPCATMPCNTSCREPTNCILLERRK